MQSDVSSTTVPYNNTGFGLSQQNSTANNYGLFTFYTANWNDAAAFGARYISHTASNAIGQMHILTANGGSLVTQLVINQTGDITWGSGAAGKDYVLTVDGETNDGVITWMEDEDYFKFSDDILMNSTERIYFNDTSSSIYDDGTDLQLTSSNKVKANSLQATDYYSGVGSQGITQIIVIPDGDTPTHIHTLYFEDGLLVQYTYT
jgi:hypothetical protein